MFLAKVDCIRAVGSRGTACKSCHKIKQKCEAVWGELAAEGSGAIGSGFPALGGEGMKLLERLVVGVEKMGAEMEKANARLERIEGVLREGAIEAADEIIDQGLNNKWLNLLKDGDLEEELEELEQENKVFREFLRSRGAEESEDSGSESRSGAEEGEVIGSGEAIGNGNAVENP